MTKQKDHMLRPGQEGAPIANGFDITRYIGSANINLCLHCLRDTLWLQHDHTTLLARVRVLLS